MDPSEMSYQQFLDKCSNYFVEHASEIAQSKEKARLRLKLTDSTVLEKSCLPLVVNFVHLRIRTDDDDDDMGLFYPEMDVSGGKTFVNFLSRPLLVLASPWPNSKPTEHINDGDEGTFNLIISPLVEVEDFPYYHWTDLQEKYVRFDFCFASDWTIPEPEDGEGASNPVTGSKPKLIPCIDGHTSLILRGPFPLVSLLNLQSQVDHIEKFHVISVNARFVLFNKTSYRLRVTAFAVCRSDDDDLLLSLPPLSSPAVRAASIVAEPGSGPGTTDKSYPLELWHTLKSGDGEIVPHIALSSADTEEYATPLRLHLSQNNRRLLVPVGESAPVRGKQHVAKVSLIIELEDREEGQQMLITVKEEEKKDFLNNCDKVCSWTENEIKHFSADPIIDNLSNEIKSRLSISDAHQPSPL